MHTPDFLKNWYYAHLFGHYPRKPIELFNIPRQILEEFGVIPGEVYFLNRNIELKHAGMVRQWNEYFKPQRVLDLGCGRGCYLYFWEQIVKYTEGLDIDQWAVDNKQCCSEIQCKNILDYKTVIKFDLVTCIDVLEHLEYEQLDLFLKRIKPFGKNFLFSIPFLGNPDLKADHTHKIFENKNWWIEKISATGLKQVSTPQYRLYKDQLLVFVEDEK